MKKGGNPKWPCRDVWSRAGEGSQSRNDKNGVSTYYKCLSDGRENKAG
jgi:hypothetical protein